MSNPPAPIIPPAEDDPAGDLSNESSQPLDPDANPDLIDSAEADQRAATEGEVYSDADDTPGT